MNRHDRVSIAISTTVAAIAMATSMTGLAKVAQAVGMPVWTLPAVNGAAPVDVPIGMIGLIACWDGMTIVAAWSVHTPARRFDPAAAAVLALATAASGAMQWYGMPAGASIFDRIVHVSPVAAGLISVGFAFRSLHAASRTGPAAELGAGAGTPEAIGASPGPELTKTATTPGRPAPGHGAEPPEEEGGGSPLAAPSPGGQSAPAATAPRARPAATRDPAHDQIANHLHGRLASKRAVAAAAAELGIPIGSARAGTLAKAIQADRLDQETPRHVAS